MTPLGWFGIVRLGLVQAGLGAVVVLVTSTLNRVMVVEVHLPAIVPGILVALHYAVQVLRPRLGYGSDLGGRRTPWIVGGMALLALGAVAAAAGVALMGTHPVLGGVLALAAFPVVGVGVGAAGTSLLTLLAARTDTRLRAPAATILWLMMIAGIAITATVAGRLMDPFSPARLVGVVASVAALAFALSLLAVLGLEGPTVQRPSSPISGPAVGFVDALRGVWREREARGFALFVFVSMLAYSAQDLVIEPFAGAVLHFTPGQSTALTGLHHAGVLAGMAVVAVTSLALGSFSRRAMQVWTVSGCAASALAALGLMAVGLSGPGAPVRVAVLVLGVANGAFAVAAIGSMMGLASAGRASREGTRVGLWGAAQALAFGAGGLLGTGAADLARLLLGNVAHAYASVFGMEAALFLAASLVALRVFRGARPIENRPSSMAIGRA